MLYRKHNLLSFAPVLLIGALACTSKEDSPASTDNSEASSDNQAPVSDAGTDQTVSADAPVLLDGSASFDVDGDALTYGWSFGRVPDGSSMTEASFSINNSSNPTSSFLPDVSGTFIVSLIVTDTEGNVSEASTALITVEAGALPVADAGADVSTVEGVEVSLDGSGSYDVLNRDLDYMWSFSSTPAASTLTDFTATSGATATFTPDAAGTYLVSLIVNNGVVDSEPDIVTVDVAYANPEAPVAVAGDDISDAEDCTAIPLNGSASYDPNGSDLTYLWAVQSKPSNSMAGASNFQNPNGQATTFFPDEAGDYLISLSVNDGDSWSTPDLIQISTIERAVNVPPTVNLGNPPTLDGGNGECTLSGYEYTCDACEDVMTEIGNEAVITDADGDPVTVEWIVLNGDAVIDDPYALVSTMTLSNAEPLEPNVCEANDFEFQLRATDCPGEETVESVIYTVSCCGIEVAQ